MVMPRRPRRLRRAAPKKRTYRPRARIARPMMANKTFTECLAAGPLQTNTGGVFKCAMNQVPQYIDYSRLYSQFCIKKFKVVLLPKYGASEPNAALVGITAVDVQNTRLAFAVNDTPNRQIPINELGVLTDNGARVVTGHRKVTITCRPKPDVSYVDGNFGGPVATRLRQSVWLNFQNGETTQGGEAVQHGSIAWWLTGNGALASYDAYDVYYYITFSVRDPV